MRFFNFIRSIFYGTIYREETKRLYDKDHKKKD